MNNLKDTLELILLSDDEGSCLLFQSFSSNIDYNKKNMFTGFVFAMNQLANQVFQSSIKKFGTSKMDLYYSAVKIASTKNFFIIIGAKKNSKENDVTNKLREVSEAFIAEYEDHEFTSCDEELFLPFINTIDAIFGTKTTRVIPEHAELLQILQKAEEGEFSENETVSSILAFLEKLPENKLKVILQSTLHVLSMFMESDSLEEEQIRRFHHILNV